MLIRSRMSISKANSISIKAHKDLTKASSRLKEKVAQPKAVRALAEMRMPRSTRRTYGLKTRSTRRL